METSGGRAADSKGAANKLVATRPVSACLRFQMFVISVCVPRCPKLKRSSHGQRGHLVRARELKSLATKTPSVATEAAPELESVKSIKT